MQGRVLCWALGALFAGGVAAAQPSIEAAAAGRQRAEAGRAAYAAGDFREAARLFRAADAIDPRPAYRYSVAIALEKAGALVEAAAVLDALGALDGVAEARARVAARLLDESPPVRVVGVPADARITLDGRPHPDGARVAVGAHLLVVEHPSLYPHREQIEVRGGAPVELRPAVAARATHGVVDVELTAPGWRLRLGEGAPLTAPVATQVVAPIGTHRLTIEAPSGREVHRLTVASDAAVAIEAPVERVVPAATWWLVSGGAVAAGVGAGLLIWAQALDADAADELSCARLTGACSLGDVRALEDRAIAADRGGWVALGVGGALLLTGGLVWWLDDGLPVHIGPSRVGGRF